MRKICSLMVLYLAPLTLLFAQDRAFQNFYEECNQWGKEQVEARIDKGIEVLFDYQQRRIRPLFDEARNNYSPVIVFEANIDWEEYMNNGDIVIRLGDNTIPFDLFYIDHRGAVKLVIYVYNGKIMMFDTKITSWSRELANKEKKAFSRVLNESPDLIFRWDMIPNAYLFIKDNEAFVLDVFKGEKYRLKEYLRLNAENIQKELEYLENLKLGIIQ